MSSSMGRMTSHIAIYEMENNSHVWNHQPVAIPKSPSRPSSFTPKLAWRKVFSHKNHRIPYNTLQTNIVQQNK